MTGVERLKQAFDRAKREGRAALIVYLTGCDPDFCSSLKLCRAVLEGGADILEVGLPFSDPIADGPTIQSAVKRALSSGATPREVLRLIHELREAKDVPIVVLTYANPILHYGGEERGEPFEAFVKDASRSGVDGLIVADLPADEADGLKRLCDREGMALIQLVAPTTPKERLPRILERCSGFVYCISLTGVTGAREELASTAREVVQRVKRHTSLPVAVGFGLSKPWHIRAVSQVADGAIVGSAVVRLVEENASRVDEAVCKVREFVRSLFEATRLV